MTERISRLQIGCVPEGAVSGPILLQSDSATFLIFNAMRESDGASVDAGRAIITFDECWVTKFGYPNDEAWSSIPRTAGLSYDVHEVLDSDWVKETTHLNRYAFPNTPDSTSRHFLILFHDSSFECIAADLSCRLSSAPVSEILSQLTRQLLED